MHHGTCGSGAHSSHGQKCGSFRNHAAAAEESADSDIMRACDSECTIGKVKTDNCFLVSDIHCCCTDCCFHCKFRTHSPVLGEGCIVV